MVALTTDGHAMGSMSESIKMVIDRNPDIRRGDVYVLNDPHHGSTHIPDITVVTPVFAPRPLARPADPDPAGTMDQRAGPSRHDGPLSRQMTPAPEDEIWFYVASRGHHAEIGGMSPGPGRSPGSRSRPAASRSPVAGR
jgi:5-oxoprolinase (ATP-hydrolysing)